MRRTKRSNRFQRAIDRALSHPMGRAGVRVVITESFRLADEPANVSARNQQSVATVLPVIRDHSRNSRQTFRILLPPAELTPPSRGVSFFYVINTTEVLPLGPEALQLRKPMPRAQAEPLMHEILDLKRTLNAVILAHNYQVPEIQDVADFVGDSLGLAQQAAKTDADVIVFCGVHFMAETAKILNPNKIVVLPDKDAGCSLEESCPADKLAELQRTNPNFWTIAYINCSAAVKALCDVIVTSGNAEKIVNAAPKDKDILFVPDENLGQWVMEKTGRPMTLWKGNCYAHVEFRRDSLLRVKQQFPNAKVIVHPESLREVRDLADAICSTEKMITYCKTDPAKQFIIATESGIIHRMQKECPGKEFICAPTFNVMQLPSDNCRCSECKYMKMNTLPKLRDCMKHLSPRVELSSEILKRARLPIERMLEISARP
jgi:quinolinate synthase